MSGVSNHYDAMVAIKAMLDTLRTAGTVTGLTTTGIAGGIVIQEVAWHEKGVTGTELDFISISPFGSETTGDANSGEDEVGYPILVALIGCPDAAKLETRLGIREKLRRRFRNKSLSGQTRNFNLIPEPLACVDLSAWRLKLFGSGIVVRAMYEEPRT